MKKRLWHIDAAATWLFASVLVASALPVHATELKWFQVIMDKSASLAELCVALPSGVSPEALLAENVQGGGKLDFTDKTDEGDVKVFSSKSGKYAFATTPKACATFRHDMMAAAEQRKLSPLWLVADSAKNACRPLTESFPPVGSVPGAAIPTAAQQAARMAGMQPELEFLSPRFAALTVMLPNQNKKTFSIFSKKSECAVYLGFLHKILQDQAGSIGKSPVTPAPDRVVKGWAGDRGWQWTDATMRKYDKRWRALNLSSPVDCSPLSLESARLYERGFVGQVSHLEEDGVPLVFMVREKVQITFMPVDLATCQRKALKIQASTF